MTQFNHVPQIADLCVIIPKRHTDDRGFFVESYQYQRYADAGIDVQFVQDNQSHSVHKGTIRGLHFQVPPFAQAKLVSCPRGRLLDVAVDIRHGSPTYGQHFSIELSAENGYQLFVPTGFAHGFCALEDHTEIAYKVSNYYSPECDGGVAFDDPKLSIDWPEFESGWVLSEKDKNFPLLAELDPAIFQVPTT